MERKDLQYALFLMGVGVSLIAYAHANFATKYTSIEIREDVREIRAILFDLRKNIYEKNK